VPNKEQAMRRIPLGLMGLGMATAMLAMPIPVDAQKPDYLAGEVAPAIRGVPFSGDGTVTLTLTLFDGTKIEQKVPARYYRDSMGRVRREQNIVGLSALNPTTDSQSLVTIVDPVAGYVYTMVGSKPEVQRTPLDSKPPKFFKEFQKSLPGQAAVLHPDFVTREEDLGKREIDGLTASGRRTTTIIPKGFLGNDRPIEVTDERWESSELKVLILSRHVDPRSGTVEYRLTKIKRIEPPKELFHIPAGYRIVDLAGKVPEESPRHP
jgi:hypothetical protein